MAYLYIALGAVAGAPLRYYLSGKVQDIAPATFPYGTLVVNVTGCLVIGLLLSIAEDRELLSREARLLLVTGFLGSYTTFSTFGWETYELLRDVEFVRTAGNILLSVLGGLFGVWAGSAIARLI